jgi:hypothetical protein
MATKFTWKIASTEVTDRVETLDAENKPIPATGTISVIHWELIGADKDKTSSTFGGTKVEIKDQVLSEVKDKDLIAALEKALGDEVQSLKAAIEEHLNPTYK